MDADRRLARPDSGPVRTKLPLCLIALLATPLAAAAQVHAPAPQPAAPETLDAAARAAVVDSLARTLERYHTSPDTARLIGDVLRRAHRAGRYDGLDTKHFAAALTDDLRAVNGDKHLSVRTTPPPMQGPGAGLPAQARLGNYGVARVEYLPGNVGYLKFQGPMWGTRETMEAVRRALDYLGNADALILDLRGVPGGSAEQVGFIFSHFVEPGTPEVRVVNRKAGTDVVRTALDDVPGPRRTDVPLYVLADAKSASAAEALPFSLQSAGRATIVGERTAGAGRNNTFVPVGNGLWASVTFTRVSDPRSGREFEAVGVTPDIAVASAEALDAAHADALGKLGRTTPPGQASAPGAPGAPGAAPAAAGTGSGDDALSAADAAAIRQAALDYIEGWYTGDAARMRRALHPHLAKRIMRRTPEGEYRLGHMTADQLVEGTARGGGSRTPDDRRRADVRILDAFGDAAVVRVDAADWVDYLQLARGGDGWVIVNVLWELREP